MLNCCYQQIPQFPQFMTFYTIGSRAAGGDARRRPRCGYDVALRRLKVRRGQGIRVAGGQLGQTERRPARVKYIIFDAKIWSVAHNAEGWRTYTHTPAAPPTSVCITTTCTSRFGESMGNSVRCTFLTSNASA
ncbi:hypothetical protein GCM10027569_09270 [Flindersiella endophytica]